MSVHESVQEYYGRVVQNGADLITNACCVPDLASGATAALMANVHEEVRARYYGCGIIAPELIEGRHILDLGCGAGHDCYVLAQMVGPRGRVTGVDMTEEQIAVATRFEEYHRHRFGYQQSNVQFMHGFIEALEDLPIEPGSIDVIISNCVLNLSPDKERVLRGAYRLLKPGGEMYFADVYADRRVPTALRADPTLYGECLAGALYWNDFVHVAKYAGFLDPRLVSDRPIDINDDAANKKLSGMAFHSATYRLFKIDGLEPACEDYGQAVSYRGTIPSHETHLILDKHHLIEAGRMFPVCGNTYRMLNETRFREHFNFYGGWERHFGIFPGCGTSMPFDESTNIESSGCC